MTGDLAKQGGPHRHLRRALRHARFGIWTIALMYVLSVLAGIWMVHSGNRYALGFRDRLVGQAQRESPILRQLHGGNPLKAAALDAAGNSAAGLLSLIAGYGVPAGYGVAAYRGWVGGVVSVDSLHHSRFAGLREAAYYLTTLLLQLLPYSLAGGAGVHMGIAAFRGPSRADARTPVLRIPYESIRDAGRIYLFSVPLFVAASLFEFLAQ
jgi:hypothetical protein